MHEYSLYLLLCLLDVFPVLVLKWSGFVDTLKQQGIPTGTVLFYSTNDMETYSVRNPKSSHNHVDLRRPADMGITAVCEGKKQLQMKTFNKWLVNTACNQT